MSEYADSLPVRIVNGYTGTFLNINSDGSINLTTLNTNRLFWDTYTDWNKGTLGTDVEVVGTGTTAAIAPKTTLGPGTEVYLSWHLNETEGATAVDSSYYNRPGTLVTPEGYNPAQWATGKLNNAISMPGESESQDYIEGGDIAGFEWNEPFSFECWYSREAYDITIAGNYSSVDGKGWSIANQEGYFRFALNGGGENYIQVYTTLQYPTSDLWQHLVITYDGSGLATGIKFYIDGVLDTPSVYYDGLAETSIVPATNNFRVGAVIDTGLGWIGQLDEINVYSVVLSQADVDFRYNSGDGTETPVFTQSIYSTTANYETNIADSKIAGQLWGEFNYIRTIPSGTTATVKCRVSDDQNNMGSFGSVLSPGETIGLSGQFIQFSVDFTGTDVLRSLVDYISTIYAAPTVIDVEP